MVIETLSPEASCLEAHLIKEAPLCSGTWNPPTQSNWAVADLTDSSSSTSSKLRLPAQVQEDLAQGIVDALENSRTVLALVRLVSVTGPVTATEIWGRIPTLTEGTRSPPRSLFGYIPFTRTYLESRACDGFRLVVPGRIELPTYRLGGGRSIP